MSLLKSRLELRGILSWALALTSITLSPFTAQALTPGNLVCDLTQGDGSSNTPWQIATPAQLDEIRDCDGQTSTHFVLTSDIDLSGYSWRPIGSADSPSASTTNLTTTFIGNLDGRGFKVTNLSPNSSYVGGLFGSIRGTSTLDRTVVTNLTVQGTATGGVFGLSGRYVSFSNIVINADLSRHPFAATSGAGTRLGMLLAEGAQVNASSISVVASGTFGRSGISGGSSTSYAAGLFGYLGTYSSDPNPNILSDIRISTYVGASGASADLAGVVAWGDHKIQITRAQVDVLIDRQPLRAQNIAGDLGGLVSDATSLSVSNSIVRSLLVLPRTTSQSAGVSAGGLIGSGTAHVASTSAISHLHISSTLGGSYNYVGALIGASHGSSRIENSYGSQTITSDMASLSTYYRGGLVGYLGYGAQLSGGSNFYNTSASALIAQAIGGFGSTSNASQFTAVALSFDQVQPSTFLNGGWSMANSSSSFDANAYWNICDHPYPTAIGEQNCKPKLLGGRLNASGNDVELYFSSPINPLGLDPRYPAADSFTIENSGNVVSIVSPTVSSYAASNSFTVPFASGVELTSNAIVTAAYQYPNSGTVIQSITGRTVDSFQAQRVANSSFLQPPTAGITLISAGISSASFAVTCTGDCGDGSSFTYSLRVTAADPNTEIVSAQSSHVVTGLAPSSSFVARVSVSYNGRVSTEAILNFNTQRPIATISAVAVNGQEISVDLSCTNCASSVSSTILTATPIAGGLTVTSSGLTLTNLALGTAYSISGQITYLGAASLVVTWSASITTSVHPMPVIAGVNPSNVSTDGGTLLTVTGSNFTGAQVSIAGVQLGQVVIVNDGELTVTTNQTSAGVTTLRVTNQGGFSETSLVFSLPPASPSVPQSSNTQPLFRGPEILSFSNRTITTAGAMVDLFGKRFNTISSMEFAGKHLEFVILSDDHLSLKIPSTMIGSWDLNLYGTHGRLTYIAAIEVVSEELPAPEVPSKSAQLLSYFWTSNFGSNSSRITSAQRSRIAYFSSAVQATTAVCWGHVSTRSPNQSSVRLAVARARATCDLIESLTGIRSVVKLKTGSPKPHALRISVQFWR